MTCEEAGKLGAEKRKQIEREPVLRLARQMREAMRLPPAPALNPPLLLSKADQLWRA